ncbi:hypothetical protein ACLOJK_016361 [Asimina triloba]
MGSNQYKKGLWTVEEDQILVEYISVYGKGRWNRVAKMTGLKRCGKSCRLRWMNYLSPSVKHGKFSEEEEDLIVRLHNLLGNRWSLIAGRVPGRTDNQVKNHWNTHLSKRAGANKAKVKAKVTSSLAATSADREDNQGGGAGNYSTTSAAPASSGDINNSGLVCGAHLIFAHQMPSIAGVSGPQEPSTSEERAVNSYWFADHNELLINWQTAPSLMMDLLDGAPLYVPWNEF